MLAGTLERYVAELASGGSSGNVARIFNSIEAEVEYIKKQQARRKGKQVVTVTQDKTDVINRYRRIESLFRQLHSEVTLRTLESTRRTHEDTRRAHERTLLEGPPPADDAQYNSSYSMTIKRRGCTEETREKLQADLQEWAGDPNGAKVYWMNGMAGTGKTTIMYSFCEWLAKCGQLGANFCCSRLSSSCSNVSDIIPTLAYQLAEFSPAFRSALCKVLEEKPRTGRLDVVMQFTKLIQEPMQAVKDAMSHNIVIAIDALDECQDADGVRLILDMLLRFVAGLPIKFFVTSRPEPIIRDKMRARGGFSPLVLRLHDIEHSIVEEDIKKFLRDVLGPMDPPARSSEIEQLAKRAGKLFIFAATAARYIYPGKICVDSQARLQAMLGNTSNVRGSTKLYEGLDTLYSGILSSAFNDELEEQEKNDIRLVLWTVVCAKDLMSAQTLALLLGLTTRRVVLALEPLQSVLHVPEGGGLVSTLHASFPDYMLDELRSGSFYCDKVKHSAYLADRCFTIMEEKLRFNIYDLESSFVFDKDVEDLEERIKSSIPPELPYCCQYWGAHLHEGQSMAELIGSYLTS